MSVPVYDISASVNDCLALDDEVLKKKICPSCRCYSAVGFADFKPKKVKAPLSATWDGALVATEPFRQFYLSKGYGNVAFLPTRRAGFYSLNITNDIPFDLGMRSEAFKRSCIRCGNCHAYSTDEAMRPIFLDSVDVAPGLNRLDLMVRLDDRDSSRLWTVDLVSEATLIDMKTAGFSGLVSTARLVGRTAG